MQNNEKDLKEMDENFEDSILTFPYTFENQTFSCRIFYDRPSNSFEMIWHLGCVKFSRNTNLVQYNMVKLNDGSNLVLHVISNLAANIPVLVISPDLFSELKISDENKVKTYTFYMSIQQYYTLNMFFAKPNRLWKMEYL